MPSEKRARQRAGREAKLAAEAQAKKRRQRTRNIIVGVIILALVVGVTYLVSNHHAKKKSASSTSTTATTKGATSTSTPGSTTTSTVPATTTTTVNATDAAAQSAANAKAVAAGCPASTATRVNTLTWSSPPPMTIDTSKTYTATIETTQGTFVATLDPKSAPTTVNNFVFLAKQGYYKCVIFHRVIPQFMDQTGDPQGTGTGGPGYTIKDENPPKAANAAQQYPLGSLAMANTGQPNSGGSQFFIVAGPEGESLPNSYALFGNVTSGMNVVQTINTQGSAAGVPPDVTNRILSVTISES